jgi:hypothetical protein
MGENQKKAYVVKLYVYLYLSINKLKYTLSRLHISSGPLRRVLVVHLVLDFLDDSAAGCRALCDRQHLLRQNQLSLGIQWTPGISLFVIHSRSALVLTSTDVTGFLGSCKD